MMFFKRAINRIRREIWGIWHRNVRKDYRARYTGGQPTIIASDCIGGVMYRELGLRFTSPTINLFMSCEDFIKFCEKLPEYLELELKPYQGETAESYPLGVLGDLVLYFRHYKTFEEAKKKWDERKTRVDLSNVYIITTDRNNFREELLDRFDKLPYINKILISHLPRDGYKNVVYLPGYEDESEIPALMDHCKKGYFLIDQFDWVRWLSGEAE